MGGGVVCWVLVNGVFPLVFIISIPRLSNEMVAFQFNCLLNQLTHYLQITINVLTFFDVVINITVT